MDILNIIFHHDPSYHKYRNQTENEMQLEEWALHSDSQYAIIKAMHVTVIILVALSALIIIIITAIVTVRERARIKRWIRAMKKKVERIAERYLNSATPHSRMGRMKLKYARFVRKYRKVKHAIKIGLRVVHTIKVRNIVKMIKGIKIKRIVWVVKQYLVIKRNLVWVLRLAILILMVNVFVTLVMIIIMVIMVMVMYNYESNENLDSDD